MCGAVNRADCCSRREAPSLKRTSYENSLPTCRGLKRGYTAARWIENERKLAGKQVTLCEPTFAALRDNRSTNGSEKQPGFAAGQSRKRQKALGKRTGWVALVKIVNGTSVKLV